MAQSTPPERIDFKFLFLVDGKKVGRKRRGSADKDCLILADSELDYGSILSVVRRERRLGLAVAEARTVGDKSYRFVPSHGGTFGIWVAGDKSETLKRMIDRRISAIRIQRSKDALIAANQAGNFRDAECPECGSQIDLSGMPGAPYIWCAFCESLFQDREVVADGRLHQFCDKCNLYAPVRPFTEWYFFFLVVFWYCQSKDHRLCDNCAGNYRWGMFLGNSVTLVACLPYLFWRLFTLRWPSFQDRVLRRGNRKAKRGRADAAALEYQPIYQRWPDHPGLLLNELAACLKAGDRQGAVQRGGRMLSACPNFTPGRELLRKEGLLAEGEDRPRDLLAGVPAGIRLPGRIK